MANYNFTIRATDSAGAFADQPFSINVQRTRIDRFAAIGTGGITPLLYRSPDGIKWTLEASPISTNYEGLVWSNDRWIATPVIVTTSIVPVLTSVDLINWKQNNIVLPKGIYNTVYNPSTIRFRSGKWYAYAAALRSTSFFDLVEFTSDDFVNWTQTSIVSVTGSGSYMRANDFSYDPATDTTVVAASGASGISGVFTRVGTGAWVFNNLTPNSSAVSGIYFLNGLWVYISVTNTVFVSRNGLDWFSRSFPTTMNGACYTNGKLVVSAINQTSYASADAGVTWNPIPGAYGGAGNTRRGVAAYGGVLIAAISSGVAVTANLGTTVTYAQPMYLGGIYSVSSRV